MARFYENPMNQPKSKFSGEPPNQTNTSAALMDLINQALMDSPPAPGSALPSGITSQQAREIALLKMFGPKFGGDIPSPETR